jgi:hypothetical protein
VRGCRSLCGIGAPERGFLVGVLGVAAAQGVEGADPCVGNEVADVPVRGAVREDVEVCEALCGVRLFEVGVGCIDEHG